MLAAIEEASHGVAMGPSMLHSLLFISMDMMLGAAYPCEHDDQSGANC